MASARLFPAGAYRAQLEAEIRRQNSVCGCELGSIFMVGAAALFIARLAIGPQESVGAIVWRGAIWVVSWSVIGKLLGLAYARVRVWRLRSELSHIESMPRSDDLEPVVGREVVLTQPPASEGEVTPWL